MLRFLRYWSVEITIVFVSVFLVSSFAFEAQLERERCSTVFFIDGSERQILGLRNAVTFWIAADGEQFPMQAVKSVRPVCDRSDL